jgi:DNA-binding GntR family transcriptional regulator
MRMPEYQRVANDIRTKIIDGTLRDGDRLPSISQLVQQYSTTMMSVKSALLVLQTEGRVEGHQGRGVFVTAS